jgi:hypothetical protein
METGAEKPFLSLRVAIQSASPQSWFRSQTMEAVLGEVSQ